MLPSALIVRAFDRQFAILFRFEEAIFPSEVLTIIITWLSLFVRLLNINALYCCYTL